MFKSLITTVALIASATTASAWSQVSWIESHDVRDFLALSTDDFETTVTFLVDSAITIFQVPVTVTASQIEETGMSVEEFAAENNGTIRTAVDHFDVAVLEAIEADRAETDELEALAIQAAAAAAWVILSDDLRSKKFGYDFTAGSCSILIDEITAALKYNVSLDDMSSYGYNTNVEKCGSLIDQYEDRIILDGLTYFTYITMGEFLGQINILGIDFGEEWNTALYNLTNFPDNFPLTPAAVVLSGFGAAADASGDYAYAGGLKAFNVTGQARALNARIALYKAENNL